MISTIVWVLIVFSAVITIVTLHDLKKRKMTLRESLDDTRRGLVFALSSSAALSLMIVKDPLSLVTVLGWLGLFGIALDRILRGVEWTAEVDAADLLGRFTPQTGPINSSVEMMLPMLHVEHRPSGAAGFTQQRDTSCSSDDEGDGDGGHGHGDHVVLVRNGPQAAGAIVSRHKFLGAGQDAGRWASA